jgi:hypothetical protein
LLIRNAENLKKEKYLIFIGLKTKTMKNILLLALITLVSNCAVGQNYKKELLGHWWLDSTYFADRDTVLYNEYATEYAFYSWGNMIHTDTQGKYGSIYILENDSLTFMSYSNDEILDKMKIVAIDKRNLILESNYGFRIIVYLTRTE